MMMTHLITIQGRLAGAPHGKRTMSYNGSQWLADERNPRVQPCKSGYPVPLGCQDHRVRPLACSEIGHAAGEGVGGRSK